MTLAAPAAAPTAAPTATATVDVDDEWNAIGDWDC